MASKKKYTNMRELVNNVKGTKRIPVILKRCVASVVEKIEKGKLKKRRGYDDLSAALSICAASFQKHGIMEKGTTSLTGKGKKRTAVSKSKEDTPERLAIFNKVTDEWKKKSSKKKAPKKKKRFKFVGKK